MYNIIYATDHGPLKVYNIIYATDHGPLKVYNIIYATVHVTFKVNDQGYAITKSKSLATKIWSLTTDWHALFSKLKSPKQVILGMTSHRITGRKEITMMLHKMNNSISYQDVLRQNTAWDQMLSMQNGISNTMTKHVTTHYYTRYQRCKRRNCNW